MRRLDAFFALVRAGLWEDVQPEERLFEGATSDDWTALYRAAMSQALVALCFDGMNRLPIPLRPPRTLYLQWAAKTAQVEAANRKLNGVLQEVVSLYQAHGLQPAILKGQGMAACYPDPLHRQCGDIDFYAGGEEARQGNQLLLGVGATKDAEASYKHTCFEWKGVHLESHNIVARLNSPRANRHFQRLVRQWHPQGILTRQGIPVPPPQFDALFIFLHAFSHFLNSGIGLRQLCDWSRLLWYEKERIDLALLEKELRQAGLLKAACAFGALAIHRLGLPRECLPFAVESDSRLEERLLEEILATGNFGQYDGRIMPRPKGYWSGKWHTFTRALRRCRTLGSFASAEALWYPLWLIHGTLVIQWKRLIP